MDRRELLLGAGALSMAALGNMAQAADEQHHHHHSAGKRHQGLITAAGDCLETGEACLAHCLVLLGEGDRAMVACARSVNEMLAICTALQKVAVQNGKRVGAMARVAMDMCQDCEKECRKHAEKHAECKACAESCAACLKECKAIAS